MTTLSDSACTEPLMGLAFLQGILLRKVLLHNYLFPNKKNNPKSDLAELGAAGKRPKGSWVETIPANPQRE